MEEMLVNILYTIEKKYVWWVIPEGIHMAPLRGDNLGCFVYKVFIEEMYVIDKKAVMGVFFTYSQKLF